MNSLKIQVRVLRFFFYIFWKGVRNEQEVNEVCQQGI